VHFCIFICIYQKKTVTLQPKVAKIRNMSAIALQGLLDYLLGTLSIDNRRWLAAHLVEPVNPSATYTKEELIERVDAAEADIQAGHYYTNEQMESFMDSTLNSLRANVAV